MNTAVKLPAQLLCIVCPNGCRICVNEHENAASGGADFTISGNQCKRGVDFAMAEITNPKRSLTTAVRTSFSGIPVLPVRTSGEIPKGRIRELMNYVATITVNRPLGIGETVVKNVLDMGVDIIATSNILKEET